MSDGNTALPVSPVTKEEVMNLSGTFSKLAQVLVNASDMPDQIKALQAQVDRLSQDLSNKTIHAEELDRTVHELRQQRDEARRDVIHITDELRQSQANVEHNNTVIMQMTDKLHSTETALDQTRKERDEYGMQVLSLEEQVSQWRDKAEKARVRMNDVMALFHKEDEPAAPGQSEPNPMHGETSGGSSTTSVPEPEPAPTAMQSNPEPVQDPHPVQATSDPTPAPEVAEPARRYVDSWQPGASWDDAQRRYYVTE